MANLIKKRKSEVEYVLYDFWMTCDELKKIGPCGSLGVRLKKGSQVEFVCDKTKLEILVSLDSEGRGELLTRRFAEYIQTTNREIKEFDNSTEDFYQFSATDVHNLQVSTVRYLTANDRGPQEGISFSWEEFDKMGRPGLLRGNSNIWTVYKSIDKISLEYLSQW